MNTINSQSSNKPQIIIIPPNPTIKCYALDIDLMDSPDQIPELDDIEDDLDPLDEDER